MQITTQDIRKLLKRKIVREKPQLMPDVRSEIPTIFIEGLSAFQPFSVRVQLFKLKTNTHMLLSPFGDTSTIQPI